MKLYRPTEALQSILAFLSSLANLSLESTECLALHFHAQKGQAILKDGTLALASFLGSGTLGMYVEGYR